jgi:glutamyl-tRNA reductase
MANNVTLLAIDLRGAPADVLSALTLDGPESDAVIRSTRRVLGDIELVIVSDSRRFELYTTEASTPAVFRCILLELLARAGGRTSLAELRTVEARGPAVVRHVMRLASGVDCHSGLEMLGELNHSLFRSRAAGTLGPELSTLFSAALDTGWRACTETHAGDPSKSREERELALLEVDRIIEEELVAWRAAGLRHAALELEPSQYVAAEAKSSVRLTLSALRNARIA